MGDNTGGGPSIGAQRKYWDDRWERQATPNAWQSRQGNAILALLRTLSLQDPRILDLGCATGWMTNLLGELGHAEGFDLSETAIAGARSRFPEIHFTSGDLYKSRFTDELFDVVVCQEVIAHVSDQARLVELIASLTKPGGYLLLSSANKFVMDRVEHPPDPEEHIKKWVDIRGLKRLLHPHFRVLRTTSVIPMGHRGVLRLVNSHKLNRAIEWIVPPRSLEALKEWLRLGYSIIALGQKRSRTVSIHGLLQKPFERERF